MPGIAGSNSGHGSDTSAVASPPPGAALRHLKVPGIQASGQTGTYLKHRANTNTTQAYRSAIEAKIDNPASNRLTAAAR